MRRLRFLVEVRRDEEVRGGVREKERARERKVRKKVCVRERDGRRTRNKSIKTIGTSEYSALLHIFQNFGTRRNSSSWDAVLK